MENSVSALVEYVKKGLRNCYMQDQFCWSYIYHLDGRACPNESRPAYDVHYSLNVIIGLASVGEGAWKDDYDLPALLQKNARRLIAEPALTYAYGEALSASAILGVPLEKDVATGLSVLIKDRKGWPKFSAQDIGMILMGICEQHRTGCADYDDMAADLFGFLKEHYLAPSHLFYDAARGFRKNFSSFSTQTYLTTACYHFGYAFGSDEALAIADAATWKMLSLQGPLGEWPWFYFTSKGLVVDNYEVYSVHQDGMAALFLTFAEKRGIEGAHEALVKGFQWIFGANQLGKNMLHPKLGMICRSILRKGEHTDRKKRVVRSIVNALLGHTSAYLNPSHLTLRLECRSYHLGWVLYSFGRREDLPEILYHPEFVAALKLSE